MRKLIIFLMIFSLIFMGVSPSVFGAYGNVGPTTEFDGDVGTTGVFKINGTALALSDLTTAGLIKEAMLDGANAPTDEDILTFESTTYDFEWHTPAELNLTVTTGTPSDSQVAVWTADGIIEGGASLTYDGSNLQLTGDIGSTGTPITKGWFTDLTVANAIAGSITGTAAVATDFTCTANNDTDETIYPVFVDGATGSQGAETDTGLTYNPNSGTLTATIFSGALSGNATTCTTASAGDAAVDFFGAGVDAVTDTTTCTDIEGDLLSITTSTLNVTIPADHITADMITTVNCGTNCTWDATNDEIDIDDVFLLHAGDIATGVHDFGGATSFEIPNSATPTLDVAGKIAYDTTVTGLTNGCLSYFGGDVRYVIDLDTLPTNDAYVVAYNATGDKFYMKQDTFSGNYVEHFMDVLPPVTLHVHAQMTGTGSEQNITTALTNPDVPRNLVVTFGAGAGTGDVVITGTLADGTTAQTENFTFAASTPVIGEKAFATVTQITIPNSMEGFTVDVGLDNLLGLTNSVNAAGDVYKATLDGADVTVGTVNTTNNTVDCGTIAANSDYTFRYHN